MGRKKIYENETKDQKLNRYRKYRMQSYWKNVEKERFKARERYNKIYRNL